MNIDTSDTDTSENSDTDTSNNSINDSNVVEKDTNDTNTKDITDANICEYDTNDANICKDSTNDANIGKDSTNDINTSDNTNNISENSTNDTNESEIDTIYGKKLRVTCTERTYKVVDKKVSFFIVTRKEFDKGRTEKILQEDMELITFLKNYEITNIRFSSPRNENINLQKKKLYERGKFEIGKKEESESTKKRRDIIMNTLKRRELFDSLDLPKEFLVRDYIEAVEKNGINFSNSAMPYDDLKWLAKKGKIEMIKKIDSGTVSYRILRKTEIDKMESKHVQLDMDPLPSKHSIDNCIN
jgi:hypothetical protein